jgi:hypothetical protein
VSEAVALDLPDAVRAIDTAELAPVVRAASGRPDAAVGAWAVERLGRGAYRPGGGVFRLSGSARDGDEQVDWSAVLKVVVPGDRSRFAAGDAADPRNMHYWAREPLAFASGLLDDLPGIAAPRCYGVEERPGSYWVWLEDVREAGPARWPLERYATAARHLGAFNGAFAAGRALPAHPWLGSGYVPYLAGYTPPRPDDLLDPATWEHPALRRLFPVPPIGRVGAALGLRPRLVDALARLPETLCHNDPFRRNLVGTGDGDGRERTVALDWEYVGVGPVGADPAILTTATLLFGEFDGTRSRELDQTVFEEYLAGLRSTGWRGEPAAVRLAYVALAGARWGFGPLWRAVQAATTEDPEVRTRLERWLELPIDRCAEQFAGFGLFLLDLAAEAEASLDGVRAGHP